MRRILPLALCLLLALGGCGLSEPAAQVPTAVASPSVAPSPEIAATPEPSSAPATPTLPVATPTAPLATLTAALSQTVVAALPPTATAPADDPNPYFRGIDGVNARPLRVPDGQAPLWLVTSTGEPDHDRQAHFVALYGRAGDSWRELGRVEVPEADFFDPEAVRQVQLEPQGIWLELEAGVGAHSGLYKLLRWNGKDLVIVAENANSSPVAGGLQDLDGDGVPEVVLDTTEHYVFCYACGERFFNFRVLRWDGSAMREVSLAPLPGDDKATTTVNQAVAQARGWPVERCGSDARAACGRRAARAAAPPHDGRHQALRRRFRPAGRRRALPPARPSLLRRLRGRPGANTVARSE